MTVSGEGYAAMNAAMNALILSFAARRGHLRLPPARALTAAMLGAAYAVCAWSLPPLVRSIAVTALAGAGMSLIAFGANARALSLVLLGGCAAAGAADFLLARGASPITALLVCVAGLIAFGCVKQGAPRGKARVKTPLGARDIPLLTDSGNLLRDPVSGAPVVVAPYALVRELLPPLSPRDLSTLPRGFRLLRARTVGGEKTLMCFRPESFCVREGAAWREKNVVIALTDMNVRYALIGGEILTKERVYDAAFD